MTKEIPKAAAKMAVWKQIAQRPHLQQVLGKSSEEQKKGVHWNLSRLSKVILNQMLLQPRISLMTIKLSKIGLCPKFLLNRKCPCLLSRCHQIFACSVLWLAAVITLPLFSHKILPQAKNRQRGLSTGLCRTFLWQNCAKYRYYQRRLFLNFANFHILQFAFDLNNSFNNACITTMMSAKTSKLKVCVSVHCNQLQD